MRKSTAALLAILGTVLLMSDCSDKSTNNNNLNPPTQQTIGPDGGTILVGGQLTMMVPPGALSNSVTFTVTQNNSPAAPGGTMRHTSTCYSIEPSGTTFAIPAPLIIKYNQASLGGADEYSVDVYSHGAGGWEALETTVDTASNQAVTAIAHLCDFVAMVDTASMETEGCYGAFGVTRSIVSFAGMIIRSDMIYARFDSAYAPCDPIEIIRNDSVSCNSYRLVWNETQQQYVYSDIMHPEFIQLGGDYTFRVRGNDFVPDLNASITFPTAEPYMTHPALMDTLSLSGFTITWANSGTGMVRFIMMTETDSTQVSFETENDGSYAVTANQLSGLPEGNYALAMFYQNQAFISAAGWDSRSNIWARVINVAGFYLR